MPFEPINDRVLIKRTEAGDKTKGGILLPDAAKDKPQQGTVIAVGKGAVVDGALVPMSVKTGDIVVLAKWVGAEIKVDDVDYLVVKESEILGILRAEA